jgi:rRNA-processing protein FCF1
MNVYIDELIQRYRRKGILVDTNILLLYCIGAVNKNEISIFKRTKQFVPEDYDTLLGLLNNFESIVTTPNILTEVSNLSGQLKDNLKLTYFNFFKENIKLLKEEYVPSLQAANIPEFSRFGLTDAAIINHAKGKYLVLTEDFHLSQYLQHEGIDAINFNHLRPFFWKT